jgi:hypothetical protein
MGVTVSNLDTKAEEGAAQAFATLGSSMAGMTKMGALAPVFSALSSPSALLAAGKSLVGNAFGTSGLTTKGIQSSLNPGNTASAKQINAALNQQNPVQDDSYLVTLTDSEGFVLKFVVMPQLVENRNVEYEAVSPPQFPGAFQKYKGTQSVSWNLSFTFIARTTTEASMNLLFINRLRGWTMPFYGMNTKNDPLNPQFKTQLGAPPPVLTLAGFRSGIVGPTPVVITALSWDWPKDVDWIPANDLTTDAQNIPFPTVMTGTITLVESFSTTQFNQFSLGDYRLGKMVNAYSTPTSQRASAVSTAVPPTPNAQTVQSGFYAGTLENGPSFADQSAPPALSEPITLDSNTVNGVQPPVFGSGGGGDFGGAGASGS